MYWKNSRIEGVQPILSIVDFGNLRFDSFIRWITLQMWCYTELYNYLLGERGQKDRILNIKY